MGTGGNKYLVKFQANGYPFEHWLGRDCGFSDYTEATEYVLEFAEFTYGGEVELIAVEEYE